ncbi:MAG: 2-oxo acid dehydrogenase subunit E2 [Moraxellaceae bacterium]|nr:2-oxo acid dehydrogenase subunit E2 [Moraxellaceae bacterium]
MKQFLLPDLGEGLHEATLIEWQVTPQQFIKQGELLLTVETAKAIVEIPAPEDLTVESLLYQQGQAIKVGTALLNYHTTETSQQPSNKSISVVGELTEAIANQEIQREFIVGSQRFSQQEQQQAAQALHSHRSHMRQASQTLALTGTRLAMRQQLSQAHQQVALVTLFDEVCVKWSNTSKALPRLITALCAACKVEPKLNAWFKHDSLLLQQDVNMGLAVNTPQGLLVPVIAQAQLLSGTDLEEKIALAKQAANELRPNSVQATISLSNFGMLAGRFATPMVVPPQVAILGVGRIELRYLLSKKGNIKKRTVIPLSLSFDHRVLTGAEAARFLEAVMDNL